MPAGDLAGRHVILCVTGSIAAYKAAIVARLLLKEGAELRVALSRSAEHFIGPATFAGITGRACLKDMFHPDAAGESHVELAAWADLILIAPATADLIARLACGRADDLVSALVLVSRCPVLVAPAMHPAMWAHPATRRNMALLEAEGRILRIGPLRGEVASGEVGEGRMAEPEQIVGAVVRRLVRSDLSSRHLVVTAGPTVEDLDQVRCISNRSSGKMGFALAERAVRRGARVTLISGPVERADPGGVTRIKVRSALELREAVWQALGPGLDQADALLMAAAVADYRPAVAVPGKLDRQRGSVTLELVPNPDILAEIGRARRGPRPVLVGFALGTGSDLEVLDQARHKLENKQLDLVVANHVDSLEADTSRAALVTREQAESLTSVSKQELAERIVDWLVRHWSGPG